ncbi:beta-1,3-glucanase family protein [Kitasatospora sp. NPDC048540]|uniref:beta-1,3-glucanase family protein n=1 Tax=unclassified Kitasatospora TaxID=2633591 RepID=UPI00053B03FF|nr:beta-1,3-glucanase family protein [Kitasatospora sp. MBT63]
MRTLTKAAILAAAALVVPLTSTLAVDAYADVPSPAAGSGFPLHINGGDGDYITIVGQQTPGHYSFIGSEGNVLPVTQQPEQGMSFPLGEVHDGVIPMPSHLEGGRIFVSKKPLVMPAATVDGQPSDAGYVQPDLNNPGDPNQGNPYDFFEYTFDNGHVPFGGNTTQVDGFSIPMTAELKQDSSGFDRTVGIQGMTAGQVVDRYRQYADGTPFVSLANADGSHITAPRSAAAFQSGGAGVTYFDSAIKKAWDQWQGDGRFKLTDGNNVYVGGTEGAGTQLTYKKEVNGRQVGGGTVAMPTTTDVAACSGALASGSDTDKFVGAHLCAAFNRGIAQNDPDTWGDTGTFYRNAPFNEYAAFFHQISGDRLAYAFAYDDVHNQSSVMILPNADAPTSLTLTIGS